ncbi:transposase [Bosea sp. LjRoot9]|uniref:IS110 family transposase n=1 Tax=Bosea sp. LjRoot9 TaxID=3342341 RepID=UPI003ECC8873
MEQHSRQQTAVKAAGIDVSKARLDVAVVGGESFVVGNDQEGHGAIARRLAQLGVTRVGLEASGNYEAPVAARLRKEGFVVIVLDPAQVHGYRRFRKKRAKTDPIDAALIAAVTASVEELRPPPDPRLIDFAEELTLIEQIGEDIARIKTRRERFTAPVHQRHLAREITRLSTLQKLLRARITLKLSRHDDLKRRYDLARSIPGIGEIAALAAIIRMPELGQMSREQAAALLGVAPFNVDTGKHQGQRHIAGGRARLRKVFYLAAFAASQRWNPDLVSLHKRLSANGKSFKVALVACVRKLIIILNAVLARGTPWLSKTTP